MAERDGAAPGLAAGDERQEGKRAAAAEAAEARLCQLARARGLERQPTPFLAVELDTLEANIASMQRFFAGRTARVRPHAKGHKSTGIARMQVDAGAPGVTCATTDEVAAMAAAGIDDILVSSIVTDAARLRSLAASATVASVTGVVDSSEALALLDAAAAEAGARIGAVVECDIGMARNGVADVAEGVRLAEEVERAGHVELRGVMAYEGHLVDIEDRDERARRAVAAFDLPLALLGELRARGFAAPVLTGSSSATYDSTGTIPAMTDVQAGTYALMDATYTALAPEFAPALAVIATVLTSRRDGRLVLDFGIKRVGTDWGAARIAGLDAELCYPAEEHMVFRVGGGSPLSVGERVAVVPGHACTTMALYRQAFGCRDGELDRPLAIDARDTLA